MVSDTLSRPRNLRPTAGIPVGIVRICWYRASKEDKAMPLSDARCRSAQPGSKLQKLTDGGGLQLWLQPTGAKLWRFAYRFGGKQKLLAIGVYPTIPLARARQVREDARRLLADGLDPSVEKKRKAEAQAGAPTFHGIADEYIAKLRREKRSEATIAKIEWLLSFANAAFGDEPIGQIAAPAILKVLQSLEARGRYESARRLRSTTGSVFRYAIATARAETDPTYALQGALAHVKSSPRAAITDPQRFGALLRAIDAFEGQPSTRIGLQLLALLFPRPGELRLAQWPEFDLQRALWTIPASRMKMRRPHRMPLPCQALELLSALRLISNGNFLFPGVRSPSRPISDGTLNAALRRLGYTKDEATGHGFRATASSLLNESGKWHPDAIERQLAHIEGNSVRAAYARGEHWDERVSMIQWWADYLDQLRTPAAGAVLEKAVA
jgi:integrase